MMQSAAAACAAIAGTSEGVHVNACLAAAEMK
jgi:hypothetical protein